MKGGDSLFKAGIFPMRGRKGQSLVEFAITLPLLVLIMFGVLDLGRAFFALITIHNAAREGARYGTLNRSDLDSIPNIAREEARSSGVSPINPIDLDITYIINTFNEFDPNEKTITVTVTYNFQLVLGLLPEIFPNRQIIMSRSVHMLMP